jgi:hypothetical protein
MRRLSLLAVLVTAPLLAAPAVADPTPAGRVLGPGCHGTAAPDPTTPGMFQTTDAEGPVTFSDDPLGDRTGNSVDGTLFCLLHHGTGTWADAEANMNGPEWGSHGVSAIAFGPYVVPLANPANEPMFVCSQLWLRDANGDEAVYYYDDLRSGGTASWVASTAAHCSPL